MERRVGAVGGRGADRQQPTQYAQGFGVVFLLKEKQNSLRPWGTSSRVLWAVKVMMWNNEEHDHRTKATKTMTNTKP